MLPFPEAPAPPLQGTTVFEVLMYNESDILFVQYTGWGVNASRLLVEPDNK